MNLIWVIIGKNQNENGKNVVVTINVIISFCKCSMIIIIIIITTTTMRSTFPKCSLINEYIRNDLLLPRTDTLTNTHTHIQ